MKRILALILAFIIFALALTGCKKPKNDDTSSTDSQTVTSEDTGSDISSDLGVLTSDTTTTSKGTQNTVSNNPTQSVTTTTSKQQTTVTSEDEVSIAPPPSEKLVLNKDFLNIIGGMTYNELKAKYGEPVDVFYDEMNSAVYKFKNSDTWYGFCDLDWGKELVDPTVWPDVPTDKNGKWIFEKAPKPFKNAKCNAIYYGKVTDLFKNFKEPVDVVDMEYYGGLTLEANSQEKGVYTCMYQYDGKYIVIESDKNYAIWPENQITKIKVYADIK